jgi:hypothetical protein
MCWVRAITAGYATTVGSSPYNFNDWTNAACSRSENGGYASITAATYDCTDYSYYLRLECFQGLQPTSTETMSNICSIYIRVKGYSPTSPTSKITYIAVQNNGTIKASANPGRLVCTTNKWTACMAITPWTNANWTCFHYLWQPRFGVQIGIQAWANNADVYVDAVEVLLGFKRTATANIVRGTASTPAIGGSSEQTVLSHCGAVTASHGRFCSLISVGQTFTACNETIKTVKVYTRCTGISGPPGDGTAYGYILNASCHTYGSTAHPSNWTALATSEQATIASGYDWTEFSFPTPFTPTAGCRYTFMMCYVSGTREYGVYASCSGDSYSGNFVCYYHSGGVWGARSDIDLYFQMVSCVVQSGVCVTGCAGTPAGTVNVVRGQATANGCAVTVTGTRKACALLAVGQATARGCGACLRSGQSANLAVGQATARGCQATITGIHNRCTSLGVGQATARGCAITITTIRNRCTSVGVGQATACGREVDVSSSAVVNVTAQLAVGQATAQGCAATLIANQLQQVATGQATASGLPTISQVSVSRDLIVGQATGCGRLLNATSETTQSVVVGQATASGSTACVIGIKPACTLIGVGQATATGCAMSAGYGFCYIVFTTNPGNVYCWWHKFNLNQKYWVTILGGGGGGGYGQASGTQGAGGSGGGIGKKQYLGEGICHKHCYSVGAGGSGTGTYACYGGCGWFRPTGHARVTGMGGGPGDSGPMGGLPWVAVGACGSCVHYHGGLGGRGCTQHGGGGGGAARWSADGCAAVAEVPGAGDGVWAGSGGKGCTTHASGCWGCVYGGGGAGGHGSPTDGGNGAQGYIRVCWENQPVIFPNCANLAVGQATGSGGGITVTGATAVSVCSLVAVGQSSACGRTVTTSGSAQKDIIIGQATASGRTLCYQTAAALLLGVGQATGRGCAISISSGGSTEQSIAVGQATASGSTLLVCTETTACTLIVRGTATAGGCAIAVSASAPLVVGVGCAAASGNTLDISNGATVSVGVGQATGCGLTVLLANQTVTICTAVGQATACGLPLIAGISTSVDIDVGTASPDNDELSTHAERNTTVLVRPSIPSFASGQRAIISGNAVWPNAGNATASGAGVLISAHNWHGQGSTATACWSRDCHSTGIWQRDCHSRSSWNRDTNR